MNTKEETLEKLNKYYAKNCFVDGYKLVLKPDTIDFSNDENVKSLVNSFFFVYNSGKGTAQQLYDIVRGLAYLIDDRIELNDLDNLIKQTKNFPSVSIVEELLKKYLRIGYKLDKKIRYGKKEHSLAELNNYLQLKKTSLFEIFIKILKENDIQIPFTMPSFGTKENDFGEL